MRPFRSFLILLLFIACFSGLSYIIPFNAGLPEFTDLFPAFSRGSAGSAFADTSRPEINEFSDTAAIRTDTAISGQEAGQVVSFAQRLGSHFDSLAEAGEQIRILYYGDSQVEADRITSFLRSELRRRYGGSGPGLFLPLMPVMYTKSINIRASSGWERYNLLSYSSGEISTTSLGPFMAICRYLAPGEITEDEVTATVRISPSVFADSSSSVYRLLRIFYGNSSGIVKLRIYADGLMIRTDTLSRGGGLNEFRCNLEIPREVKIEFSGRTSPDIYGISIEGESGIVIDNIPQRGSAGLEFTMADSASLAGIYNLLGPDLFILHYGLNIVKGFSSGFGYYQRGLERQLKRLKETAPSALQLVIGITDMAMIQGDTIRSYSNLEAISVAQREASISSGSGYWDSRRAMGGENSIVSWSELVPPLAQKDLVHLTNKGSDTLASYMIRDIFSRPVMILSASDSVSVSRDTTLQKYTDEEVMPQEGHEATLPGEIISRLLSYDPSNPFIFTTPGFWLFLLFVLAGYSLVYGKIPLRNLYLFLISLYFYFKAGGLFLFLLLIVTGIDYSLGIFISASTTMFRKRLFLALSVVSNIGLLSYFKYAGFIADSINRLLNTDLKVFDLLSALSNSILGTGFDTSSIILPVGISFFTFQSLSYTIDIYRNRMEPVRNIIDFGFYVSFFPHLVAGPIVRASVFMPQVYQQFSLTRNEFSHALFMISKGLVKKIIISNFIAVGFVDRIFSSPSLYSGFENLMAVYGYGLQIYCDFSGYTDIAIGVALILGFRLPVNFNSPYKASSITEFWKRWHISLSRWLRDYLYISLGGNRRGRFRTYLNLMITMLLGGLWHGASLRFILWGALHGAGLIIDRLWKSVTGEGGRYKWISRAAGLIITFNFVNFCWIFFRAESMNDAFLMIRQIWSSFSPGSYAEMLPAYATVIMIILTGYIIHFLPEKTKEAYRGLFINIPVVLQLVLMMLLAVVLYNVNGGEAVPFIYFRF